MSRLQFIFQSTPSVGRATITTAMPEVYYVISIHALRGEGDNCGAPRRSLKRDFNPRPPWGGRPRFSAPYPKNRRNFNPRPPWGGRPARRALRSRQLRFQSTPSVGRATLVAVRDMYDGGISIHALRGEGDSFMALPNRHTPPFQSTPSVGRATCRS